MAFSYSLFSRKSLRTIVIVLGSMSVAFFVGIRTADQPVVSEIQADSSTIDGDLNGNGHIDITDARIALELAAGYRTPSPAELQADPNQDFVITVTDALAIVQKLEHMPVVATPEP